jgi:hypothetical protein
MDVCRAVVPATRPTPAGGLAACHLLDPAIADGIRPVAVDLPTSAAAASPTDA